MKSAIHCINPVFKIGAIGIVSLISAYPGMAIEPPADDAEPPAALQNKIQPKPGLRETKQAFIGVVTAPLPEMVADHLKMKPGTGLIVRTVLPDSPADKSGLKTNDIILNVNDAPVNDPETLSEKIRAHKIGDKLKLQTIQRGQPSTLEVTLGERPAGQIADLSNQQPLLEGIPETQAKRLRDMIERNLNAFGQDSLQPFENMLVPDQLMDQQFKMLREHMNKALEDTPETQPDLKPGFHLQQQSVIRMMDNEGSVEFKRTGKSSEVIVRDPDEKVVWSGPWDTAQDKAAAPDEIRERIEKLQINEGDGIHLRFGK